MIIKHVAIVKIVTCEIDKAPSNNLIEPLPIIEGNTLGFDDHNNKAAFCKK